MSDEPERKRKSRPKSEVVKSSHAVDGEKKHSKKSHSKKSHSHRSERTAEMEQLKKDLDAAKDQIASLQTQNEVLAKKADNKSSNSSSDENGHAEENSRLKSELEEKSSAVTELEETIGSLRDEIANLKALHERALEAEFEKLASAQNQIRALEENKPKPITGPKVSFQQNQPAPQQQLTATSPRGGSKQDTGAVPVWKLREMEKQKEAEEARAAEQQRKLQKVASIRLTLNDVHKDTETPTRNFKDPLDNKVQPTVADAEPEIVKDSANLIDITAEEKANAEMARLGKTLKRGGHNI